MFGDKLKKRREEKGLTQKDVAKLFDLSENYLTRQAVSKWEQVPISKDERNSYPDVEKLLILSIKLDISLDELFADELSYLRKEQQFSEPIPKYSGAEAGLKIFADKLKDF